MNQLLITFKLLIFRLSSLFVTEWMMLLQRNTAGCQFLSKWIRTGLLPDSCRGVRGKEDFTIQAVLLRNPSMRFKYYKKITIKILRHTFNKLLSSVISCSTNKLRHNPVLHGVYFTVINLNKTYVFSLWSAVGWRLSGNGADGELPSRWSLLACHSACYSILCFTLNKNYRAVTLQQHFPIRLKYLWCDWLSQMPCSGARCCWYEL